MEKFDLKYDMNVRVLLIWAILCGLHILATLLLPLVQPNWVAGTMVVYLTILLLAKIGIPGLMTPAEGWGWPAPKVLGWSLGILVWLLFYYGIACLIAGLSRKGSGPKKETL